MTPENPKKQKKLKPIKEKPSDFDYLEAQIIKIFREEIYLPLIKELAFADKRFLNASDGNKLIRAIESGKIIYQDGRFVGKLNATLSKQLIAMGARFNKAKGSFGLSPERLSPDINRAISLSITRFNETAARINSKIKKLVPEQIAEKLKVEKFFDRKIFETDVKIQQTLKNITVSPKLTDDQRKRISKDYTNNLQKYIQDFSKKEIGELRKTVEKQVIGGARYEDLIGAIESSYGVSKRKAKFLARQETGLMMAQMKKSRYLDAGVDKYIWTCVVGSPLHPVRPMHKALNGKQFSWKNPPITNEDGARNNPGEDYNCRCYGIPVVEF